MAGRLETAKKAIELGATNYVEKPVSLEDIRRLVGEGVERTRIEKRRRQIAGEISGLVNQLTSQLEKETRMADQGREAMRILQELDEPLRRSVGNLDEAFRHTVKNDSQASCRLIRARKDMEICRELLDYREQTNHTLPGRKHKLSAAEFVQSIIDEVSPWAASAGVRLDYLSRIRFATFEIDKRSLRIALRNLFAAAIEATASGGRAVRVSGVEDPRSVDLRIEYKPPMKAEYEPRFDFASEAIRKEGGTLVIQAAPGKTTVILLKLPYA